jgi:hypothetical protein
VALILPNAPYVEASPRSANTNSNTASLANSEDEPYRIVIFTHGLFLRSIRKGLAHFENNDAMRVVYDTEAREFIGRAPEIHRINNREVLYDCPDDCRVSRCSEEAPRNWGSAGRKEQMAIFKAEKGAKKYTDLYNIQKPKTFKNYLKSGWSAVKRVFTRRGVNRGSVHPKRD